MKATGNQRSYTGMALGLAFLSLAGRDYRPGGWPAIVYQDRSDRTKFVVIPHFTIVSYCLESAGLRVT